MLRNTFFKLLEQIEHDSTSILTEKGIIFLCFDYDIQFELINDDTDISIIVKIKYVLGNDMMVYTTIFSTPTLSLVPVHCATPFATPIPI